MLDLGSVSANAIFWYYRRGKKNRKRFQQCHSDINPYHRCAAFLGWSNISQSYAEGAGGSRCRFSKSH